MPPFLCSLREAKLWLVAFPLANMSAHNCSENPFTWVLNKKPMNVLPGIKEKGWRGRYHEGPEEMRGFSSPLSSLSISHRRNRTPPHPLCNWHRGIAWSGLMHFLQWYYAIIIWGSLPKPIAPLTRHPGGPLPSHSPQTKHVKLILRLELVPGSHRQVSSSAAAPERGRKLISQEGGMDLPLG